MYNFSRIHLQRVLSTLIPIFLCSQFFNLLSSIHIHPVGNVPNLHALLYGTLRIGMYMLRVLKQDTMIFKYLDGRVRVKNARVTTHVLALPLQALTETVQHGYMKSFCTNIYKYQCIYFNIFQKNYLTFLYKKIKKPIPSYYKCTKLRSRMLCPLCSLLSILNIRQRSTHKQLISVV